MTSLDIDVDDTEHIDFKVEEFEEVEEESEREPSENFLLKNTDSFRCLAQVELSHSSLHGIDFYFPKPEDPGINETFYFVERVPVADDVGLEIYLSNCKENEIVPCRRVKESLATNVLNLKYYGLTEKQMKCICEALKKNDFVHVLNIQDNHLTLKSTFYLCDMLRANTTITVLNLYECRIGDKGAELLADALSGNRIITELNLSYNEIGDEGFDFLVATLTDVSSIKKLILSHNLIGENCGHALYDLFDQNWSISDMDLSWNQIYHSAAMAQLCKALSSNESLRRLNLSWNGIGSMECVIPIYHCLVNNEALEFLDLSSNRLNGQDQATCLMKGIALNNGLQRINLGYTMFHAEEGEIVASSLLAHPTLQTLDLSNMWFKTSVRNILRQLKKQGKQLIYGGILDNFGNFSSPVKKVVINRAQYLAENPKKKKYKKNFGHLLLSITQDTMSEKEFNDLLKKNKVKFDADLKDGILSAFTAGKKILDVDKMKQFYLELYPDTVLPQPPASKKKKKKKGKKGKKKGKKEGKAK